MLTTCYTQLDRRVRYHQSFDERAHDLLHMLTVMWGYLRVGKYAHTLQPRKSRTETIISQTKGSCLYVRGISPLKGKVPIESNPSTCRISVRKMAVPLGPSSNVCWPKRCVTSPSQASAYWRTLVKKEGRGFVKFGISIR